MTLPSFAYSAPTIVWFAPDGIARLGSYLKRLGIARGLLVCDAGVREAGIAERVLHAAGGRLAQTWSGVEADAPKESIEAGAAFARDRDVDGVVAVGGGSTIDSGKAIALLARHGGDLARWDGASKVPGPGLPLACVPTTAGTGSEVTNIFVVKDSAAARKLVVIDRAVYPQVAVLDPRLTTGLPPRLTTATGLDALTHAVEGLVADFRNPICEAIGLECVRLVARHLPRAFEHGDDLDARGHMLIAASMAGQLVSLTFSGVSHAVAHALGVGWGVHHGTGNALALPWSIRLNANHSIAAAKYARALAAGWPQPIDKSADIDNDAAAQQNAAHQLADTISSFAARLGMPARLGDVGLGAADLPRLAALAFADPSHTTNPVKIESAAALERALETLL